MFSPHRKSLIPFFLLLLWPALAAAAPTGLLYGPPTLSTGAFSRPFGLAVDASRGRLLVADTGNHRFKWIAISSFAAGGYSEHGYVSNRAAADALNQPQALAADGAGTVYVVNTLQGEVKRYEGAANGAFGAAQTMCPAAPHSAAGVDTAMPRDIAVGPDGAIYLLDSGNNRVLKATASAAGAWTVFAQDPAWKNPYGLDVDDQGNVYVADTGNHRIVKISTGAAFSVGVFGTGRAEFRFPRDVAVDRARNRLYVADTFNHRVQVLDLAGNHLIDLGRAPLIGTLDKVETDADGRVFTVDSDNERVLGFLGPDAPPPFDAYLRDFVGDPGDEPSNSAYALLSPDILIRHAPDVDLAAAAASGLEAYDFQSPRYGRVNHVYVALHNRGPQPAPDNYVKVFWLDPSSAGNFPVDWKGAGLYQNAADLTLNRPGNALHAPLVPPGGTVVLGPLLWLPPAPDVAAARNGRFRLAARLNNPYDPAPDAAARVSNNLSERPVTVQQAPFPTGDQNTLFVSVHFPDFTAVVDASSVAARAAWLDNWLREVSGGAARVLPTFRGPVNAKAFGQYSPDGLLVELAQDVLDDLLGNEPDLLDGAGPGHEIGRIVLVTNFPATTRHHSTTGAWPFRVPRPRLNGNLSVSLVGMNSPAGLYAHGMAHQLGLQDLYAYGNGIYPGYGVSSFSRPYADGWDTMALATDTIHPLVWSKELASWVTSTGAKILYVPRPAPGALWNNGGQRVHLTDQIVASTGQVAAVAFGLTNGVTSFTDETAFYYVESRRAAGFDATVPAAGVVMYYANKQIPQGQGPVILRDHVPGGNLADAVIPDGQSESPGGTGIRVTVRPGTSGADHDLELRYDPPATDYDVSMRPGTPYPWESPDIWVDNQKDGYDEEAGRPVQDRGNLGIAGEDNRVYAKVSNAGPATAFDVEVAWFLSEPYHTVGGQGSFDEFKSVFIDSVPAGGSAVSPKALWRPKTGTDPHTCARVDLRRLFNDTNAANNGAQRNLQIDHSVHGSPYTEVRFPFQVTNDTDTPKTIYFRAEGVPSGWTWSITPPKALAAPGATVSAVLSMKPPESAPDCTTHRIAVTGWVPAGDTLVRLGGATVQVELRQKTAIDVKAAVGSCSTGLSPSASYAALFKPAACQIAASGCTDPKRPNEDIVIRYEGPDGNPIYKTVHTDANGCYEDFNVTTEGGAWQVSAEFGGGMCAGPAMATGVVAVPLPERPRPEPPMPDEHGSHCLTALSLDAAGTAARKAEGAKGAECPTASGEETVLLKMAGSGLVKGGQKDLLEGELVLTNLRHVLAPKGKLLQGLHRGRFTWKSGETEITGSVTGLTNVGTHHKPALSGKNESGNTDGHRELSLEGVVVKGRRLGERLRAVLLLEEQPAPPRLQAAAAVAPALPALKGVLEGVLVKDCGVEKRAVSERVKRALALAAAPPMDPCPEGLPCLQRISKYGEGQLVLNEKSLARCDGPGCGVFKTWSKLEAAMRGVRRTEAKSPVLRDGLFTVERLAQALAEGEDGRGIHTAAFRYVARDGVVVEGTMAGVTRAGTHRKPTASDFEPFDAEGHLEGALSGVVTAGPSQGARVEARYAIQARGQGRRRTVVVNIDGWGVTGCLETPRPPAPEEPPPVIKLRVPAGGARTRLREAPLPSDLFRSLAALPATAVKRFSKSAGGKMTPENERALRIADKRFSELDADKDGALSAPEFSAVYKLDLEAGKSPLAKGVDLPSPEEAKKTFASQMENQFKEADGDRDGRLDLAEFALWHRRQPAAVFSTEQR